MTTLTKKLTKPAKSKTITKTNRNTIEKEIRAVKKLNNIFKKATPAEKRIIIAKDVIAQIELGKFIPTKGEYFQATKILDGDLQTCIIKPGFKCQVCEIGGLFTSLIRIENNFSIDKESSLDDSSMRVRLTKYFSEEQLALVETAFESSVMFFVATRKLKLKDSIIDKAVNYRERKGIKKPYRVFISSDREQKAFDKECKEKDKLAMIAICENIISNKGSFRPER